MALYVLKDPAMAEEVTLDVFLQIWQRASQFDPNRGKPITWVTVLARSRSIDRLRACQKEKGKYHFSDAVNVQQTVQPTMETLSVACDQTRAVQKALTSLSPEQRQVIEMAYFSGFSQREIAEKINKPLGTVKTRIRLGMVNLRKTLSSLDKGCVPW
jgi:RNA polymerase sigma-70 factor (ECF subfamily)